MAGPTLWVTAPGPWRIGPPRSLIPCSDVSWLKVAARGTATKAVILFHNLDVADSSLLLWKIHTIASFAVVNNSGDISDVE